LLYDRLLAGLRIQKLDKGIKRKKTERLSDGEIEAAIKAFTADFAARHGGQTPAMELTARNIEPFKRNKQYLGSLSTWIRKRVKSLGVGRVAYVRGLGIRVHPSTAALEMFEQNASGRNSRSVLESI
jgi:hypothetical protein